VSVEAYFHSRAEQFDALYGPQPRWQRWWNQSFRAGLYERAALTVTELRGLENFSVLDVGCGSGRNSLLFAEAGARRVVGIDIASNMIDLANQAAVASPAAQKLTFVKGDFFTAAFDEKFDACIALGFFDYIRHPVPALRRMAELANQKVIASFPGVSLLRAPLRKLRYALRGCPVYFYSQKEVEKFFKDAGLPECKIIPYASSGWLAVAEVARHPELTPAAKLAMDTA
jgi:SAM-dependent methyltransferase